LYYQLDKTLIYPIGMPMAQENKTILKKFKTQFNMFFNLFKTQDNSALAAAIKNKEAVVIDVRTRGEYMGGHVADSLNIPMDEIPQNIQKIKKMGKMIVLCCASGNRSGQATQFLKQQGLTDVHNGGSWTDVNHLKNK
jgi:rhodanese-related sulfurtransferase